jgi:hypothetical protein
MKAIKNIAVYLGRKCPVSPVDVVQIDTGVQLVFKMMDFEIPDGTTATLYVQKPSGNFVYQDWDIVVSGNRVAVDLHNQAIAEHGNAEYQLKLTNGGDTVSTFSGILRVGVSLADAGATESETVASAFDKKLEQMLAATISATHDNNGNVTMTLG